MTDADRTQLVRQAMTEADKSYGHHLDEVLWFFIEQSGGPRGFGKLLLEEFKSAKSGSVTRQRILDMLLGLARFIEKQRPSAPDLGTVSMEDLQREFQFLSRKVLTCEVHEAGSIS